ncbi:MAG: thiamine pyrophosphate-dependent enzyme [Bacteroidales bacterium]
MKEVTGIKEIIKPENLAYRRSEVLTDNTFSYCHSCGHGTAHRILAEVIQETGIQSETIGVAPVVVLFCCTTSWIWISSRQLTVVHQQWLQPSKDCFQRSSSLPTEADDIMAAIGTAETIHACNRGENIMIIFVNNGIYGMTGSPDGSDDTPEHGFLLHLMAGCQCNEHNPIKMGDLVALLPGTCYVTRQSVHTPSNVKKTKKAMKKAVGSRRKTWEPALSRLFQPAIGLENDLISIK